MFLNYKILFYGVILLVLSYLIYSFSKPDTFIRGPNEIGIVYCLAVTFLFIDVVRAIIKQHRTNKNIKD